ncbi:FAD dependent oxidoreductase [Chloroherpeton thalassium ATCC 35110]|uniref:FAD dependent oxidoreductase n=1 Tax=Chloroherpeton thalassium (strain ATCC 35110 / GB-78) TaxID=517418 RepID=B3QX51_CHLT3|nr:FAD dependent oxidoreductase [Chloroherpeton thalassium ATCC 35110]
MKSDAVIVGGGISGLSLAFYCAKAGMKTTLLEKNTRLGGSFHSHQYQENQAGFWTELGAHTCYSSYQNLLGIAEDCGIFNTIIPREKVPFTLLKNNEIKSIVSGINFLEAAISIPNLFSLKKDGLSVREYYSKIIGKKNYENTVRHFFNAVPSQPTDDFPAEMMFKSRPKRKDVLKDYTFKGGLQSVAQAIAKQKNIEIISEQEAESVTLNGGQYTVTTKSGESHTAEKLGLAVPSAESSRLLQSIDGAMSAHLGKLLAAQVDSVAVVLKKSDVPIKPVAAIISPSDIFFSMVSRDTVADATYRGFTFHFQTGLSDAKKMKRITEVLGVDESKILYKFSTGNIVPSLRIGHKEWLDKMDSMLKGKRLLLTGNYFGGMAIEDCVSRSRSEFERMKMM